MKLSSLISEGMVLQRETTNTIWGKEAKGDVTVSLLDGTRELSKVQGTASDDGSFELQLPEMKAGGPYVLEIKDDLSKIVLNEVCVGDVFLLAGQSNMEIPVSRTLDLERKTVSKIHNEHIRHFEVPKTPRFDGPTEDIYEGTWKKATQENLYPFSAVGFFFAELVNKNQGVPVGLIQTAVGGIQIEALIPEEKLLKEGERLIKEAVARGENPDTDDLVFPNHYGKFSYKKLIEFDKDEEKVKARIAEDERRTAEHLKIIDEGDIGVTGDFAKRTTLFDEGETPEYISVPGRWENLKENAFLENVRGSVWVLKRFEVPDEYVGKEARLVLGTIIDADETYINGVEIGRTEYRYPPRRYPIPAGILKKQNTLVVRIRIFARAGGFVDAMPYYVDLLDDHFIPLVGKYEFKVGVNVNPNPDKAGNFPDGTFFMFRPCGMYNNMIHPLRRMSLKGMLFYQGESNTMYYNEYDSLMRLMASSIRECFNNPQLKMAFVELPYYGEEDDERGSGNWDKLRLAQERARDIPHSVLVDIYDLGFRYELHPQNKRAVAERLYREFSKLLYS